MSYKKLLFIFLLTILLLPNIYSAKLTNFDVLIDIRGPQKAFVTETWVVGYDPLVLNDKENFKQQILLANLDLDKFSKIDPNLKPKVYLKNFSNVSIIFDETKDQININYEVSDLFLQNFYETDSEIIWKFNENVLRGFIVNNLYVIPSFSKLIIKVYDPLIINDTNPKGEISKNIVTFNSFSSNELKILVYEKKPPKPSFVIIGSSDSNLFYYLIIIFIILITIILIFREPLERAVNGFVVRNSVIKPKKQKKEFAIDSEFFDD